LGANGQAVGGIVGFLNELGQKVDMLNPKRVIVIWEGGGSPRRRALFAEYKMHRKPQKLNRYYEGEIPDTVGNRNWQVSTLVQVMRHLPIQQSYVTDCEADDVIAYIARYRLKDDPCVVMSSDKDYYQLLDNRVRVWSPTSKSFVTAADVLSRFGCTAQNFIATRCFVGDGSDGIPGIDGAGWKTMAKRFPEVAGEDAVSTDDIVSMAQSRASQKGPQVYRNIIQGADAAALNWKLMYLDVGSLSGNQVGKIESGLESFRPAANKMDYLRHLVKTGINNFDRERVFFQLTSHLLHT
jgi:DNA polymerase-1